METISLKDRKRLRELAKKQMEYAQLPLMKQREREWFAHNTFCGQRPMIHLEMGTFEQELIPQRMECEGEAARNIEREILRNYLNFELFDDDKVVPAEFSVSYKTYFKLFGHEIKVKHASDSTGSQLGHQFQYVVQDLEEDWEKLGPSQFGYLQSPEETRAYAADLSELLGDILPVKIRMNALSAVPTQLVVHMMGMEQMMFSMYDYPDLFVSMMDRIAEDYLSYFRWLESERSLLPTVSGEWLGQGTFCYTDELPGESELAKRPFFTRDVWGYMDSQETVSISPQMFEEMIFPCYQKIAGQFGLLSYGCCEPVHPVWDNCISRLENLRKVSISPWCDEAFMGERLRGKKVIYQRKPSPNFLGVGTNLEEEAVREHITKTLRAAQGCHLEITQRDVYTINGNPQKARRYIRLIRECIQTHWKG